MNLSGHCCADGGHCCPRGYSCGKDACVLDLAETQPWDSVKKTLADDIRLCPDGLTICSAGQLCCRGDFGANSWKCCP
ncbi:unnamed protein product [Dibothriocephalus latus]|uniref:Granulins domain-containing protein n=1 Tax=Dibothriocephalus latus TaxID=60516 RepID=A0A3P7P0C3_DIBLA|nr:unnamed protein product [Dibothriocephalus latus]